MTSLPTDLPYHLTAQLTRAHILTVEDALLRPASELGYLLQLSLPEIHRLRARLATHLANPPNPKNNFSDALVGVTAHAASSLSRLQSRLPLGDPVIDGFLRGGLPWPAVVEVAGPAGAGKSQLCFQLMARCLHMFPSPRAKIVHISSYSVLPVQRILQLVPPDMVAQPGLLDRIVSETISDIETLVYWLTYRLPLLFASVPSSSCPLLVLDSITPLFRGSSASLAPTDAPHALSMKQRHALLADLARTLHKLAHVYQMTLVVVNQAAADPNLSDARQAVRKALTAGEVGRGYLHRADPRIVPAEDLHAAAPGAAVLWRDANGGGTRKTTALALAPVAVASAGALPAERVDKAGGPALGLEWSRAVHHRVYLTRPAEDVQLTRCEALQASKPSVREMYVLAGMGVPGSLEVGERRLRFEIRDHGLVGMTETDDDV